MTIPQLSKNALRVQQSLIDLKCECQVVELSSSTRTAQEAANSIGTTVAQIAKSLLFIADDKPILVLASGINRVSLEKLTALTGCTIRMAKADEVKELTGYPIGGVAPLGHPQEIETVMDQDLLKYDLVWAAAGTPQAVFSISPQKLQAVTSAQVADIA